MKSTINLFKALPIKVKRSKKASSKLLKECLSRGVIFSPEIIYNYDEKELIKKAKEIGITGEQLNSSFHKSWAKVRDSSMEQLVMEQLIHYFTTYGYEALGIYDKSTIFIPKEKLEVPQFEEGITLTVIKGYTKTELKFKLMNLLGSGIALKEDTMSDVIEVALFVGINEYDISKIKNKEVKVKLYDLMNIFPENQVEFLRYLVYKSTEKTLLIKDKETTNAIKEGDNLDVLSLLIKYKKKYGLEKLSEIFLRFKPIFLALKSKKETHKQLNSTINKIRKLAKKNHKPLGEDYLNEVTAKIKKGEKILTKTLNLELDKVNTFRKIRLAYALKFRTRNVEAILYRIRNGKSYAKEFTDFTETQKKITKKILGFVLDSIIEDMKKNVEGKRIYLPENITYALPATEKQFTGYLPSGTCITVPKDMVFGVHWNNVEGNRIDLDLSLINADGKIGWDSDYRNEGKSILFSGDVTDASGKNGASELFYVKRQAKQANIMMVNYFNYDEEIEVPFKIIVGQEQVSRLRNNYMLNPNNVASIAHTKINKNQMILGLIVTTTDECRFYYTETSIGNAISSSTKPYVEQSKKYLFDFYSNTINLNDMLKKAGAVKTTDKEECDIDLSSESLEKDTIINLLI